MLRRPWNPKLQVTVMNPPTPNQLPEPLPMNLGALIEGMRVFDARTALLAKDGGSFTYRQMLGEVKPGRRIPE